MGFKISPYKHGKFNTIKFVATLNGMISFDIVGFADTGEAHVLTHTGNLTRNMPYFDKVIYFEQVKSLLYEKFEFDLVDTPVSMFENDYKDVFKLEESE